MKKLVNYEYIDMSDEEIDELKASKIEYDAARLREAINSIDTGTSTPEDIDIYCDFLSKYDV